MAHVTWNINSLKAEIMNRIYQQSGSLRKVFRQIDSDGSGVIDRDEMRAVLHKFNLGGNNLDEVAEKLLAEADPSGDGEISFNEFSQTLKVPDTAHDAVFSGHQQHVRPAQPGVGRYGHSPKTLKQVAAEAEIGEPEITTPTDGAEITTETARGSYEMDTDFAVFKLRVIETLVHSDSMADIKRSMAAVIRTRTSMRAVMAAQESGEGMPEGVDPNSDAPITVQMTLNALKESLAKHGARGIHGLSRKFKIMDDDGSGSLNMDEFAKAMKEHSMGLSKKNLNDLFNYFDGDGSGNIAYDEFLIGIRGALNERRRGLVQQAFDVLDKDGSGQIEVKDIMQAYDASKHPDVISGKRTKAEVFREFLDTFDGGASHKKDGIVTRDEFEEYYANCSASIDNDDYFELMIRNAWHISGGEGWCANTTNRRVHVAWVDGSHTIEEVMDDLAVGTNVGKMKDQFEKRTGKKVKNIELVGSYEDEQKQPTGAPPAGMSSGGRPAPGGDSSVVFG